MMTTASTSALHDFAEGKALHTFTVEQYMALDIPERTELLEGLIYDLSPKNAPHSNVIERLHEILVPALLGSQHKVRFEQPIAVSGWTGRNGPEIDVAVIARKTYLKPPTAADAIGFIEVSDTTYHGKREDRAFKIPLYVRAGVPSWIVNIPLQQVEHYPNIESLRLPHGVVFQIGDTFAIAGVTIEVTSLFAGDTA
jgi:hypothetical protein